MLKWTLPRQESLGGSSIFALTSKFPFIPSKFAHMQFKRTATRENAHPTRVVTLQHLSADLIGLPHYGNRSATGLAHSAGGISVRRLEIRRSWVSKSVEIRLRRGAWGAVWGPTDLSHRFGLAGAKPSCFFAVGCAMTVRRRQHPPGGSRLVAGSRPQSPYSTRSRGVLAFRFPGRL